MSDTSKSAEITKLTQIIQREDGTEVRIVAQAYFGAGLHRSVGVDVHKRESPDQDWVLLSDKPHPDWLKMSVADYIDHGRSPMLQAVSHGELLKAIAPLIGGSASNKVMELQVGMVFSNGAQSVRLMANAGSSGFRLDQHPSNGLVFAPWFRDEKEVREYLASGGHANGAPFLPDKSAIGSAVSEFDSASSVEDAPQDDRSNRMQSRG